MAQYDYIIAGSGLAGLYTAFRASKYGTVALITKTGMSESNSYYAQGGIASVTDEDDSPTLHFEDTIVAGRGLCDYSAVDVLVNEGPDRIRELMVEGMHFDMEEGSLALGLEGGHHRRRILHAGGDITGKRISEFMIGKVLERENIRIFENHSVIGVLEKDNCCYGVRVWNSDKAAEELFYGQTTLLALGGISAIYKRTTNPETTTGDGIALAYNANCRLEDMEFIQFHPTTIYSGGDEAFLISEAVRGEGAYLYNIKGERFMTSIHELAELAPRDVVAQAIYREISRQQEPYIYLSLKHLDPELIQSRFPNIYARCREMGIDMCDKVPIAPAAHYSVGGVKTDGYGMSNIRNLYICGELASTGIMGANRLASNSLIECLVFGYRAIENTVRQHKMMDFPVFVKKHYADLSKKMDYLSLKNRIAGLMTNYAGIIRSADSLTKALVALGNERDCLANSDDDEYYTLMSNNLITVAELVVEAALHRKESRGCHYRTDYPKEESSFANHTIQQKGQKIKTLPIIKNRDKMNYDLLINKLIDLSFEEDIDSGDITTNSLIPLSIRAVAELKAKADGIIAGIDVIKRVFSKLDQDVKWTPLVKDGDAICKGQILLRIEAGYRALLTGERTALNILQRMSGIATTTSLYAKELSGLKTKLLDTRKTAPGMRILDKMAVKAGGGENHRMGLFDMAMIKDNHIKVAGGITNAVTQLRKSIPPHVKIEVETSTLEEVKEAIACNVEIIMLDNMNNAMMKEAVLLVNGKAQTEASGNMTLERIREVAETGVDFISVGALTHTVKALDISMNISVS